MRGVNKGFRCRGFGIRDFGVVFRTWRFIFVFLLEVWNVVVFGEEVDRKVW